MLGNNNNNNNNQKGLKKSKKKAGRKESARLKSKNENFVFCPRPNSQSAGFMQASEKQR